MILQARKRNGFKKGEDARMVHHLIKKTAQELAGAFYEYKARKSDWWYKQFPDQNAFIASDWTNFVLAAKQVLATSLQSGRLTDAEKTEVYEALTADAELPYSHQETQVVNIPH